MLESRFDTPDLLGRKICYLIRSSMKKTALKEEHEKKGQRLRTKEMDVERKEESLPVHNIQGVKENTYSSRGWSERQGR